MVLSVDAVIGLGANLGQPQQTFRRALRALPDAVQVLARSHLYRTAAIGPEQPDFRNAAVLVRSSLPLQPLLRALQGLELSLGRVRRERWGPRVIDLDLLWAGEHVIDEPGLVLPHPRLTQRAFALRPLLDVMPDAVDPTSGCAYADCMRALASQRIDVECDADTWAPLGRD